jgi:glucan phosphorylase
MCFAGKASPSDFLAKQIIHLINVTKDLVIMILK